MLIELLGRLTHDGKEYASGSVIETDDTGFLPHEVETMISGDGARPFVVSPQAHEAGAAARYPTCGGSGPPARCAAALSADGPRVADPVRVAALSSRER